MAAERPEAGLLLALVAGLSVGCGSGPKLHNLRCRATPCQSTEDPFRLLLAVDFDDPTGSLSDGALELRVDGATQNSVALRDLFSAQGIDRAALKGTLDVDQDVVLDRIQQNKHFSAGLIATNGKGQQSNEPTISFTLTLGGSGP